MTGGCFQILLIFCNAEGQWKGNNKKKNYLTNSYALSFGCKRQERVKSAAERGEEWRYEETEGVGEIFSRRINSDIFHGWDIRWSDVTRLFLDLLGA